MIWLLNWCWLISSVFFGLKRTWLLSVGDSVFTSFEHPIEMSSCTVQCWLFCIYFWVFRQNEASARHIVQGATFFYYLQEINTDGSV